MTITEDGLLAGRLTLFQPERGHRAGTDGVLLAAAAPAEARQLADFGASTGLVGLAAALALPQAEVTLFECDPALVALAQRNIAANCLSSRVRVIEADLLAKGALTPFREAFDAILTNPPFFEARSMRLSPTKAGAHALADGASLDLWVRRAAGALRPGGSFVMIHRADHLAAVLAALQGRFGAVRLRFVHARRDSEAIRVLVQGRKGSRAPLVVGAPLVLHATDGIFTPEIQAVHAGEARLAFPA